MVEPNPQQPLPRDKETLLREVDARIRIKDIKSLYTLREQIEVKWWEPLILLLLFSSALGFLGFVLLFLINPHASVEPLMERSILMWLIPLVFTIVLTLEIVLNRLNSVRQLDKRMLQLLEEIQRQLDAERAESSHSAPDSKEK